MGLSRRGGHRLAALLAAALGSCALLVPSAGAALEVSCEWPPPGGPAIAPDSTDVMQTPAVGDLDGDGLPEIVFLSFVDSLDTNSGQDGVLRVLSGADCSEILTLVDPGAVRCFGDAADRSLDERGDPGVFCPACGVTLGDVDEDGRLEIVLLAEGEPRPPDLPDDDLSAGAPRRVVVLEHDGTFVTCGEASPEWLGPTAAPALADLDADGRAEIVSRGAAWNLDGSLRWARPPYGLGPSVVADLDEDGRQEVVLGQAAYREDGALYWVNEELDAGLAAVADMNLDCVPEVVFTAHKRAEIMVLNGQDGSLLAAAPLPGGLDICTEPRPGQGGAPTLADVDGDLIPEIGVAGCLSYSVYRVVLGPAGDVAGLVQLWSQPTVDDSSRITSSTFFDLEGDGELEVLYQDHERLWVYDGRTGAVRDSFELSNSTLIEYPALADVDADGQAEVVVVANDYILPPDFGIRVLHDALQPWTPTRALLNQHAYHQTNVLDDGRIPRVEEPSWRLNNNYRAQVVPSEPVREDCAPPPELICDPGGPYSADCALDPPCPGGVELLLEAVEDPLAESYTWTIDCGGELQVLEGIQVLACVPLTCEGCAVRLEVRRPGEPAGECGTVVDWLFSEPALTIEAGPYAEADCAAVPSPEPPEVSAACGVEPELVHERERIGGPCPGTYTLIDRWSALDACGSLVADERVIDVSDTSPPVLEPAPPDESVACGEAPPPAVLGATDDCSGAEVEFLEERFDGPCPDSYRLLRTWTATDACGNAAVEQQEVVVEDRQAPVIEGVPPDERVPCGAVPPPASPTASDDCDPAPAIDFREERIDGSCPHSYDLLRTWTATDRCGNAVEQQQRIEVRDLEPPVLVVPEPLVLECEGGGGFALDDPRIQDWLRSASATDDCTDPVVVEWDAPPFFPVGCPDPAPQVVTFRAVDECGNEALGTSTISVVDTTPPEIVVLDLPGCLWSPNHVYACFTDLEERVAAVDSCGGEVAIQVSGCASDQPDEAPEDGDRGGRELGNGDGHHFDDCVIAPDGSGVCVRYERQGTDEDGRHYGIAITAVDACGNAATLPWELFVPHDQREHPCPNAKRDQKVGPNEPFPWER